MQVGTERTRLHIKEGTPRKQGLTGEARKDVARSGAIVFTGKKQIYAFLRFCVFAYLRKGAYDTPHGPQQEGAGHASENHRCTEREGGARQNEHLN